MVSKDRTAYNFDADTVRDWLDLLYGACGGHVSIVSTSDWAGSTFPLWGDGLERAGHYVERLELNGPPKGTYARVTTLRNKPVEGARGGDEDSSYLPGLWADMDLMGPGHKTTKKLPASMAECEKIIHEAALPEPTLWVHSGGGLYPWWLFDEPWELEPDEGFLKLAQEISRTWQDTLSASAEEMGLHYGPVPDLARVLRIPGTINRKVDGDPQPCRIIEQGGPRYTAVDIAAIGEVAKDLIEARRPAPRPPTPRPTPPLGGPVVGGTERPGDALAASLTWMDILAPAGYRLAFQRGDEEYWVRPGKHVRDGHSVTTNYSGSNLMWVFSTECEGFESNTSYTKFAAWSITNGFGMDFSAAARALGGNTGPTERQVDIIREILGEDYTPRPPLRRLNPPPRPCARSGRTTSPTRATATGYGTCSVTSTGGSRTTRAGCGTTARRGVRTTRGRWSRPPRCRPS